MNTRYYDPPIGRFLSEDPAGFGGGDLTLYSYVGNNPFVLVDPNSGILFLPKEVNLTNKKNKLKIRTRKDRLDSQPKASLLGRIRAFIRMLLEFIGAWPG